jgi:hypothetical protein
VRGWMMYSFDLSSRFETCTPTLGLSVKMSNSEKDRTPEEEVADHDDEEPDEWYALVNDFSMKPVLQLTVLLQG